MAESGWQIYAATAIFLGATIIIYFAERAYRYKRLREGKSVGTYGFRLEGSESQK
jgi:hypothetical protein